MLVRCARCQAVFSVQDGLAGPVQRTFSVECGRCLLVFEASSAHAGDGPRTATPRRISTPPPSKQMSLALPAVSAAVNGRRVVGDDGGELATLRPAIYGPVARHNPLTRGGAIALATVVIAALIAVFVLNRPRVPNEALTIAEQARAALLLDDDHSLERAASLFAEASRLARGAVSYEGDRAFALLLRGAAKRDVAEHLDPLARGDAVVDAGREAALREGARLIQEGASAANAALQRDGGDAAAQRSLALAAALTSGNPRTWLEEAARTDGDDPLLKLVSATAELAGGRDGAAQERAA
ncbi:MAG TPA: MJ0042-type zinc finger domain-containing protein, partial [Myxococcales bacterium]|nr:MJ0042-type zinc finger domain-containing protein [Myxococcales bacterium]